MLKKTHFVIFFWHFLREKIHDDKKYYESVSIIIFEIDLHFTDFKNTLFDVKITLHRCICMNLMSTLSGGGSQSDDLVLELQAPSP